MEGYGSRKSDIRDEICNGNGSFYDPVTKVMGDGSETRENRMGSSV